MHYTGTAYFNAIHGCQKCKTLGKFSDTSGTVVYPDINQESRTDEDFRANKYYPNHQKYNTALTQLPVDIINDVIVADELHLLELGVMKKLLVGWRTGKLGYATKWSSSIIDEISEILINIKMPREMNRDVRSMKLFANWKGQEFRNFLFYYGLVVLKDFLPAENYIHFLQLFAAATICSSTTYFQYLHVAHMLFDYFIIGYKRLYGVQHLTSNIHNLNHIVAEVKQFGELSTISAYPFENYLGIMKRIIKGGKNPLVQIARRLSERLYIDDYNYKAGPEEKRATKIVVHSQEISLELSNFTLINNNFQDQWFATKNYKILCMRSAYKRGNEYFVTAYALENDTIKDFFDQPFQSSLIHTYIANVSKIKNSPIQIVPISEINFKYVAIMYKDCCVFTPLLHTL